MSEYRPSDFRAEMDLAEDMKHFGRRIFDGSVNLPERMARCRAAIIAGRLAKRIIERTSETKPETFAEAFERVYKQPLHQPTQGNAT